MVSLVGNALSSLRNGLCYSLTDCGLRFRKLLLNDMSGKVGIKGRQVVALAISINEIFCFRISISGPRTANRSGDSVKPGNSSFNIYAGFGGRRDTVITAFFCRR
jgi:hypothetical protein